MSAPWSRAVWIQSIQGRRFIASTGPVAPSTTTGMRSHQALKIAMVACCSPTLECTAVAIARLVTLAQPCAMATADSSCTQMLLCVHEESAVAIAHGWAKVTSRAIATAVHSNVGLQHATMAIFSAWCDRMPVVVLGATGPVDAMKRRPWIDWIHTARDQGALIRGYTKWDDQ